MQQVQLYIEDKRVEMFDFESVSITDSIKNVKDVSKIFTEYSQTFSLPASKVNNKVFTHFYNSDIEDGFDARVRVRAKLELNSIPFKNGYIKLEGVDLRDNKPNKYRVTFFGNTVTLKNLLGEDLLSSLSWLNNFSYKENGDALLYNAVDIENYLTTEVSKTVDGVVYVNPIQVPLITHSQRLIYDTGSHGAAEFNTGNVYYESATGHRHGVKWKELKYAVRMGIIVKAIEKKYTIANGYSQNLVFSDDFFQLETSNDFSDLYMWLHRVKGDVTTANQLPIYDYTVNNFDDANNDQSYIDNSTLYLSSFGQVGGVQQNLRLSLIPEDGYGSVPYSFSVLRNGLVIYTSETVTGDIRELNIPVEINEGYNIILHTTASMNFNTIFWSYSYFDSELDGTVSTTYYTNGLISIPIQTEFSITQQIPKMKVLDFLTAVFKMFNLVAYVQGSELVVMTLDEFYAGGVSYDINKYIDVKSSQSNAALPFKEIVFGYEGLGTFLADRHDQLFNEEWGTEEYDGGTSTIFTGGVFKYKIPFEHMKFERLLDNESIEDPTIPATNIQWGYCVDSKQDSYIGKPLVFYIAQKQASISFAWNVNAAGVIDNKKEITSYFAPSNSNLKFPNFLDRQSINFSPEADEWELTTNYNSLFNKYHSNYMTGVFNKKNRLTKITAYLPLKLLLKYTLADRFQLSGRSYKINSIETDLHSGKSEIELFGDFTPTTIDLVPPSAPTNLALVQGTQTQTGFTVDWTASTDDRNVIGGYIVELNQDYYTTIGNVTTYDFTGLVGGTDYRVAIFAFDASGNKSDISNILDTFTLQ